MRVCELSVTLGVSIVAHLGACMQHRLNYQLQSTEVRNLLELFSKFLEHGCWRMPRCAAILSLVSVKVKEHVRAMCIYAESARVHCLAANPLWYRP